MKTLTAGLLIASGLLAQSNVVPILTGSTRHDHYLFNQGWQFDERDYASLPHSFYFDNANTSPPVDTQRSATYCEINSNPATGYNPAAPFDWYLLGPYFSATSEGAQTFFKNSGLPDEAYASIGEYYESAQFSYTSASEIGFQFVAEFNGQHHEPQTTNGSYVEAVYFSDRECFDGGTEYGWYHQPVDYESCCGTLDQPDNQVYFYYSEFTNCGGVFYCSTNSTNPPAGVVAQKTSQYEVTFNQLNKDSTYQFSFKVVRCPVTSNCEDISNSANSFVLNVTDPSTGDAINCSISPTPLNFEGTCKNVTIPIASWYPGTSVTNTGYIAFADRSSTVFPSVVNTPSAPPPANNVVPSIYPTDPPTQARYAGLFVQSADVLYQ
jgi:hypothetical protein